MPETKTGGKLRLLLTCHFSTVIYKTRAKALEKNFLPFIIIEESYLQTFSHSLDISYGFKLSANNIGHENRIYTFPYFCTFLLKRFMRDFCPEEV